LTSVQEFCESMDGALALLFSDLSSGISAREDSRAFGAMIERRITDNWDTICATLNSEPVISPGRRTIYDFACVFEDTFFGFDVKTKDLDSTKYSDGGVCAVGNLLKFLANDRGIFTVVEFGHNIGKEGKDFRDLEYIRVAPFHLLPENAFRIENLGTGQVRLNYSINQLMDEVQWDRSLSEFFDIFTDLSISHYERVGRDAIKRADAMRRFRADGYGKFVF
jgi:hypothetical protein